MKDYIKIYIVEVRNRRTEETLNYQPFIDIEKAKKYAVKTNDNIHICIIKKFEQFDGTNFDMFEI